MKKVKVMERLTVKETQEVKDKKEKDLSVKSQNKIV